MQDLMPPVKTPDNLFHDGDPTQGIEGTIVTAEWLNNDQSAVRDIQQELVNVLAAAAMQPDPSKQDQLITAINSIIGGSIPAPPVTSVNTKTGTVVLSAADVGALPAGGTAAAATKLATARTIGGVAFDGTANINLPGVNTAGNQSTTGNAATASKLATARTIAGVAFDGSANISISAANVGALPASGGRVAGNLEIYTAAPILQLTETDTGKKYFIVVDGSGFRINEDSTGGNAILSYSGGSKILSSVGQIAPGAWTNFDARYQAKGSYTPAGQAYTKAESDGRYPLKTATVIGARVGARGTLGSGNGDTDIEAPVGNYITGRVGSNGDVRYTKWYIRAFQINVNGTWKTITA